MSIQPLLEVLDQLIAVHREMLTYADEKTPILVNNEVEALNTVVHKEGKLVKQVLELERLRVQTIGEFLISRGYNPDPRVSVGDLIKIIFKAEDKQQLTQRQQVMAQLLKKLQDANELNQQLIQHSLSFIDHSLDLIVGSPDDDAMYQNPLERTRGVKRQGIFDSRA